jgi:hypothetical protein
MENSTNPQKVTTSISSEPHLSPDVLLWMRSSETHQMDMDRWKGPHAQLLMGNKGVLEYRQLHLSQNNPGLWPTVRGVETVIPLERKIDGIADVTLKNYLSILRGKKQQKLAFADEVNLFKRTLLYLALPSSSRWFHVGNSEATIKARSIVFFRMKNGVKKGDFKKFFHEELSPALANTGVLLELRTRSYLPWIKSLWNPPNVLHDNAKEVQFQASMTLGFADRDAMMQFFASEAIKNISERLSLFCEAIHAYEIHETLTFVKDGVQLPHYIK